MTESAAAIAKSLAPALYADLKALLVSLGNRARRIVRNTAVREFPGPAELLTAIDAGSVAEGDWVKLRAIPSPLGPFLRNHLLPFSNRMQVGQRLGPPILGADPIFAMMANSTSQLVPVGLFPPTEEGTLQGYVYPSDVPACGFVGFMPGVNEMVRSLPTLFHPRHAPLFNVPCWVQGLIRNADPALLTGAGFSPEKYEELRQGGRTWFLDCTSEDSRIFPIGEREAAPLWGSLYASGHLEIGEGTLPVNRVVEVIGGAMHDNGIEGEIIPNQAGPKEINFLGVGFRAVLLSQAPIFSLHMDADLGTRFSDARHRFDRISQDVLRGIQKACHDCSVELKNPTDLDFTYTDATSAFSVLRSDAANLVADPVAMAVRDWHRRRSRA